MLFPGQATSPRCHLRTLRKRLCSRSNSHTFPFPSHFWETSSVQKWVGNFCPRTHFGRLSSLQSTPRFQGQVTTLFMCSGEENAVTTKLWEADPPFHQQQSGSARRLPTLQKGLLMPVWALLPSSILAWSPTQAPFVIYLSLLKNWRAATEFDSFLWLGCTLPRVSLKITKVSIIMWRLCIWEMGGLCHIQTIS